MSFKITLFTGLFLISTAIFAASEHSMVLKRSQWPQYENGANIISLPQVSDILKRFEENDKISIEIRYPGGDFGRKWGESLTGWFVTFGVPARFLELLPGSGAADQIVVALIDRR